MSELLFTKALPFQYDFGGNLGVTLGRKPKTLTESIYSNGKTPVSIRVQDHTTFIVDAKGRRTWRFRANTEAVKIDTNVKPSGDMAKDKAMFADWSVLVKRGINPRAVPASENAIPRFREVAVDHIAHGLGHITNAKNLAQPILLSPKSGPDAKLQ